MGSVQPGDYQHARRARWPIRLGIVEVHLLSGDANMSEYATALKIGTPSLVMFLIELDCPIPHIPLENPVLALRQISRGQLLSLVGFRWEERTDDQRDRDSGGLSGPRRTVPGRALLRVRLGLAGVAARRWKRSLKTLCSFAIGWIGSPSVGSWRPSSKR
ncbi:MAG: hypothetical protein KatS3mg115_0448 [Candidatus Poribacteria bacterium]|nr:MAG: hypothetical protein KatS3mg115_0448 [Candidatus Poribacteria bacterium]